ncbi:MAG: hypothetical protein GY792_16285 [Gammaproteobacteria bacterium]|nr:hypothetical protein [Gammaproteobacteria bacterium]
MKTNRLMALFVTLGGGIAFVFLWLAGASPGPASAQASLAHPNTSATPTTQVSTTFTILVDDFIPQPYQGEPIYFYNRLGGDRGLMGDGVVNANWGPGQVTITLGSGNWGGVWTSLNHPIREELPINFQAILPEQIFPEYQSQITGLTIQVVGGTAGRSFKIEIKDERDGSTLWFDVVTLTGNVQTLSYSLPALGEATSLNWLLDNANPGDFVVIENIALTATTQITDVAQAGFVWSYGMLLNDWNPDTGLVRDKAKDATGEFDAIQSTGSLAAATTVAEQLGIITYADAVSIVTTISNTLLTEIPRYQSGEYGQGLWPHWVELTPSGTFTIVEETEWSSVDTAIAALSLYEAQSTFGLGTSGTEAMLLTIDWAALLMPNGISHGYDEFGALIPYAWDTFGGESWLLGMVYAAATGQVAPIEYCTPPTANGSGFIDELAWLFAPVPATDCWGTDWEAYRQEAAEAQITYYPTYSPTHCYGTQEWFGLSAAEVPVPSLVPASSIYQPFGVGGRFDPPLDGSLLPDLDTPVVVPHYSAMIASVRPTETLTMWAWLINQGAFSPLTNIESLMSPTEMGCNATAVEWNQLKGSWNLALQTLGWGRYLAEREGLVPVLWQTVTDTPFLSAGYDLMASVPITTIHINGPSEIFTSTTLFTATYEPVNATLPITFTWDNGAVGDEAFYTWEIPGFYTVAVTATNRCGNLITVTQPVTVHPVAGVKLTPDGTGYAEPGDLTTYTHTLTNTGNTPDTFFITHTNTDGWPVGYPVSVSLAVNTSAEFVITVTVPADAISGTVNTTVLTATSQNDPDVFDTATDYTLVNYLAGVALSPDQAHPADPGEVVLLTHTLTNTGNGLGIFDLTHHNALGWEVAYPSPLVLDAGQTADFTVSITVPTDTLSGTKDTSIITATSRFDANIQASVTDEITVQQVISVTLSPGETRTAQPGDTLVFTHALTNSGNFTDIFTITSQSNLGWNVSHVFSIPVGHGQTATVAITLNVPVDTPGGSTDSITITATSQADSSVQMNAITTINIPNIPSYVIYLPMVLKQ